SDEAGSAANSKEFSQRERSEELRYVREKEAEDMRKFRAELDRQKKKLDELEASV
ncbi:hypothetical protein CROQUDRAFT_53543, partial [Cronartium quercuum f. sp. fusiforme G11]